MRDRDIAAAIVAGDPAGLAAAYDAYAAGLHAYCRSLLGAPADAAGAVQDTFVVAAAKVVALWDRDRLRPWMYAVARNECHRRLRGRARQYSLEETGELTAVIAAMRALPDGGPAAGGPAAGAQAEDSPLTSGTAKSGTATSLQARATQAPGVLAADEELADLVLAAIGGVNLGDREVIELNLRHDLDGADLADVLGVPASQVHALVSRARAQLERSLGVLVVARAGRQECARLDALLVGWDGRLTVRLRKQLSRHIEECATCAARPHGELGRALTLSVLPLMTLPDGLSEQVLGKVSDPGPDAVQYRDEVAERAGEFGYAGFPVQIAPAGGARQPEPGGAGGPNPATELIQPPGQRSRRALLGATAAALVIVVGAAWAAYLLMNGMGPGSGAAAGRPRGSTGLPGAGPVAVSSTSPSAGITTTPPGSASRSAAAASSTPGSSAPAKSAPGGSAPGASPSASPTGGDLTVSPGIVQLPRATVGGLSIGSFTLTAVGGPVTYAISGGGLYLSVSPASGTLAARQTQTVSVSLTLNPNGAPPPSNTTLTVSPDGRTVSIEYPVSALVTRSR